MTVRGGSIFYVQRCQTECSSLVDSLQSILITIFPLA